MENQTPDINTENTRQNTEPHDSDSHQTQNNTPPEQTSDTGNPPDYQANAQPYQYSYSYQKYAWQSYVNAMRPKTIYNKNDTFSAIICLILGYLFSRWVFFSRGGIGMTLFCFFVILTGYIYLHSNKKKLTAESIGLLVVLLLFSLSFALTSAFYIKFFCFWFLFFGFIYWCFLLSGNRVRNSLGGDGMFFSEMIKAVFVMPFGSFTDIFGAVFNSHKNTDSSNKSRYIIGWSILGLIIAVIPTFIVISLLCSADGAFANLIRLISDNFAFDIPSVFSQISYFIFGIPVAMYIFGLLFGNARNKHMETFSEEYNIKNNKSLRFAPPAFIYAAVTPVCVVYLLFFAAQSAYLFSGFSGIKPENITFAEYARSGFFEMCAVSFINLFVIIFIYAFCKHNSENTPKAIRVYTSLLSIFTMAMIAISLSKMVIYIRQFGLTQKRVYTSWLMVVLGIFFIFILIKQIKPNFRLLPSCSVCCILLLCFLAFGNIDGNIAKYNVSRYINGSLNELDIEMFYYLSDDAIEQAIPLLNNDDPAIKTDVEKYLQYSADKIASLKVKEYTLGSIRAKAVLEEAGIKPYNN